MREERFIPEQIGSVPHTLQEGTIWKPFSEGFPVRKGAFRTALPLIYNKQQGRVVIERTLIGQGHQHQMITILQAGFDSIDRTDPFRRQLYGTVFSIEHPAEDAILTFPPASEGMGRGVSSSVVVLPSCSDEAMVHIEIVAMSAADYVRILHEKAQQRLQIGEKLKEATVNIDINSPKYETARRDVLSPYIKELTQKPIYPHKLIRELGGNDQSVISTMWQCIDNDDLELTSSRFLMPRNPSRATL